MIMQKLNTHGFLLPLTSMFYLLAIRQTVVVFQNLCLCDLLLWTLWFVMLDPHLCILTCASGCSRLKMFMVYSFLLIYIVPRRVYVLLSCAGPSFCLLSSLFHHEYKKLECTLLEH